MNKDLTKIGDNHLQLPSIQKSPPKFEKFFIHKEVLTSHSRKEFEFDYNAY